MNGESTSLLATRSGWRRWEPTGEAERWEAQPAEIAEKPTAIVLQLQTRRNKTFRTILS